MANYTTKLVDRTNASPSHLLQAILRDVQSLFDEALEGAGLQVAVSWGDASETDNYVVHFVEDKTPANSYLLQTWPHANIDPRAGGHTYRDGVKSGSEVYRFVDVGSRSQSRGIGYAKLIDGTWKISHDTMCMVLGWGGGMCDSGASGSGSSPAAPPVTPLTTIPSVPGN